MTAVPALSGLAGLGPAFVIGLVGGTLYFTGLWWTVRRLTQHRLTTAGLVASWLVRVLALMGALYWAMDAGTDRLPALLAAAAGVLVARAVILRRLRSAAGHAECTPGRPAPCPARNSDESVPGDADADHAR